MPGPATTGGETAVWYSHNVGGAHWIMLSNYHAFDSNSAQYAWLKADLASIDNKATPWIFVNTHAPWCECRVCSVGPVTCS